MTATVHVDLTTADRRAATNYACGRRRKVYSAVQLILMGVGAVSVGFFVGGGIGGLIAYAVFVVVLITNMVRARRKLSTPDTAAGSGRTFTVNSEGFVAETADAWLRRPWGDAKSAKLTQERLFLRQQAGSVFCVPLRCFESVEAEADFVDIVAAHVRIQGRSVRALTPIAAPSTSSETEPGVSGSESSVGDVPGARRSAT